MLKLTLKLGPNTCYISELLYFQCHSRSQVLVLFKAHYDSRKTDTRDIVVGRPTLLNVIFKTLDGIFVQR